MESDRLAEQPRELKREGTLQSSLPKIACPQAIVALGVEELAILPKWHLQWQLLSFD